jgi:type IV secretory pathway VirB2 component (pilin)
MGSLLMTLQMSIGLLFGTVPTLPEAFGNGVLAWLNIIIDFLLGAFTGVVALFWDATTGTFTVQGLLMLFSLAMAFIAFAIAFITRLIKK